MKKTLINLAKAYVGESQARNRYTFYAKIAKKEGYEQIAGIFIKTANQEKEHAKRLFEHLRELADKLKIKKEELEIETSVPIVYGTTKENLKAAINGESYENTTMYPEFAAVAESEGYKKIAARFKAISRAEEHHEERYQKLLKSLVDRSVFKKEEKIWWVCRECGYVHYGETPPKKCPSCDHAQAYYEIKCEKY
jgi:rubrerythrin